MFETGNFVDIRFQDQPRYLQPAGIYWLQAASVALLSKPEEREVWALSDTVAGRRDRVGAADGVDRQPAVRGADRVCRGGVAGGSVLLGVEARMAKIDAVLLAVMLAAQAALARIYLASGAGREAAARAGRRRLLWLALGVGLMLKGPIILLVVLGTVLLLVDHRAPSGVAAAAAAGLGRAADAGGRAAVVDRDRRSPARASSLPIAIGNSLLGKVATGQQSHGAPPGYHLAAFPLTFWPGSLFAALAVPFAGRGGASRRCASACAGSRRPGSSSSWSRPSCRITCCRPIRRSPVSRRPPCLRRNASGRALGRVRDAGLCRFVAAGRHRAGRAAAGRRLGARIAPRSCRHPDRARGRAVARSDAACFSTGAGGCRRSAARRRRR